MQDIPEHGPGVGQVQAAGADAHQGQGLIVAEGGHDLPAQALEMDFHLPGVEQAR